MCLQYNATQAMNYSSLEVLIIRYQKIWKGNNRRVFQSWITKAHIFLFQVIFYSGTSPQFKRYILQDAIKNTIKVKTWPHVPLITREVLSWIKKTDSCSIANYKQTTETQMWTCTSYRYTPRSRGNLFGFIYNTVLSQFWTYAEKCHYDWIWKW